MPEENNNQEFEFQSSRDTETQIIVPENKRSFWSRNGATILTIAVLGVIIGGAIAINQSRTSTDDLALEDNSATIVTPKDQDSKPQEQKDKSTQTPAQNEDKGKVGSGNSTTVQPKEDKKPIVSASSLTVGDKVISGKSQLAFTATAEKGEGRTHLARRAITEQMKRNNIQLSAEQRVYAEDFLQKQFSNVTNLDPGDSITFTADQVNEAIGASQQLSPGQVSNLHQFAVNVNFAAAP